MPKSKKKLTSKIRKELDKIAQLVSDEPSPEEETSNFDFDLNESDYGFILDGAGDIKALIMPAEIMSVPPVIAKIFQLLEIGDPTTYVTHKLH